MKTLKTYISEGKWMDQYIENKYSDPAKNAVWNYVAGYTTGINNILRRGGRVDKEYIKLFDSAFTQKSKINVYRTIDWKYLKNVYNITENNLKDFIGSTISNKGYMSTSSECKSPWGHKWREDEVVLHIYSSRVIPIIDVNAIFDSTEIDCSDQSEIILPRNLEMQIKNYSNIDKTLFIELEII